MNAENNSTTPKPTINSEYAFCVRHEGQFVPIMSVDIKPYKNEDIKGGFSESASNFTNFLINTNFQTVLENANKNANKTENIYQNDKLQNSSSDSEFQNSSSEFQNSQLYEEKSKIKGGAFDIDQILKDISFSNYNPTKINKNKKTVENIQSHIDLNKIKENF